MTVKEAREKRVCRICGDPCGRGPGKPKDWEFEFGKMVFPEAITTDFGAEYAHTDCLEISGGSGAKE